MRSYVKKEGPWQPTQDGYRRSAKRPRKEVYAEATDCIWRKFKGYYKRVKETPQILSDFEVEMFKSFERSLVERGFNFPTGFKPIFLKEQ